MCILLGMLLMQFVAKYRAIDNDERQENISAQGLSPAENKSNTGKEFDGMEKEQTSDRVRRKGGRLIQIERCFHRKSQERKVV